MRTVASVLRASNGYVVVLTEDAGGSAKSFITSSVSGASNYIEEHLRQLEASEEAAQQDFVATVSTDYGEMEVPF